MHLVAIHYPHRVAYGVDGPAPRLPPIPPAAALLEQQQRQHAAATAHMGQLLDELTKFCDLVSNKFNRLQPDGAAAGWGHGIEASLALVRGTGDVATLMNSKERDLGNPILAQKYRAPLPLHGAIRS